MFGAYVSLLPVVTSIDSLVEFLAITYAFNFKSDILVVGN